MKKILVIGLMLATAGAAKAINWYDCESSTTDGADACEGVTSSGPACYEETNPRGECVWLPFGSGCNGSGNAVTLTVVEGYCYYSGDFDAYVCDTDNGTDSTEPGTAAC